MQDLSFSSANKLEEILTDRLMISEGFRQFPYKDSVGILTIGYGRNLAEVGVNKEEAKYLLINDLKTAILICRSKLDWFNELDLIRQSVIADMVFNMGFNRFLKFKKFINFIIDKDYANASKEMLNSLWATQVKGRATNLSRIFKDGKI